MHPNISLNKGALPVLRNVIQFTERRHVLLANNIANVETPLYQAQDLPVEDFQALLAEAVDKRREGNPRRWKTRDNFNVGISPEGTLQFRTMSANDVDIQQHSQNNVDIDKEMVKLAENSLLHNTAVELLHKQYNLLHTAISERVS